MNTSNEGLDFIKSLEDFSPVIYKCSKGKNTIGYGHVIKNDEHYSSLDLEQAINIFKNDIDNVEKVINKYVTVKLNQNQFDALVALVFNIGANAFLESNALKYLNDNNFDKAIVEFFDEEKGFTKISKTINGVVKKIKIKGLVNRRNAEKKLFIKQI